MRNTETLEVTNNTVSVWNLGPVEPGGEHYTMIPGVPLEIPVEFLKRFDRHPVIEHAVETGKLTIKLVVPPALDQPASTPAAPAPVVVPQVPEQPAPAPVVVPQTATTATTP